MKLPNIKEFPDYYEVIKKPVDLDRIGSKLRQNNYATLEECQSDLVLMFDNACKYNEPDSQIYKDALMLQNVVSKTVKSLLEEDLDESSVPNVIEAVSEILSHIFIEMYNQQDSDERCYSDSLAELPEYDENKKIRALNLDLIKRFWAVFSLIRYYKTNSGNALAEPFLTLPSKRELPDYYVTIKDPISLNIIRKKIKNNEYGTNTQLLVDNLMLMFDNCKAYNRPDSRLYKDACKLSRFLRYKYNDMTDSEEGQDSSESETEEKDDKEKKMRTLYNTLLNFKNSEGVEIIGMFMEKPSKKDYPDYYEVIANPIDMNMINERIKKGLYKTVEDFVQGKKYRFSTLKYNLISPQMLVSCSIIAANITKKAQRSSKTPIPSRKNCT